MEFWDKEDKDNLSAFCLFLGIGFICFAMVPFCIVQTLHFMKQPVELAPVDLSGRAGNLIYFGYPTEKFPRTCLFPRILETYDVSREMSHGIDEGRIWVRMPVNQTQLDVTYSCNSLYNVNLLVNLLPIHPENSNEVVSKQERQSEAAFVSLLVFVVYALPIGFMYYIYHALIRDNKGRIIL